MNGNTQGWTWLNDGNSMLSSHNIPQAYFMQITYGQWFVFEYLMLCHNCSVQFLDTEKLGPQHADCSISLVKRVPFSLHSYKMTFSSLAF